MSTIILNRGFPDAWKAGQLEQEIFATLKRNIDTRWPTDLNLVINPTFIDLGDSPELLRFCMDQRPDRVFVGSTTDPLSFTESVIYQWFPDLEMPIKFGYFDGEYNFDFWALACGRFFKNYSESDLQLASPKYLFVNYNRKPHYHRQSIARALAHAGLDREGVLTLGKYPNQEYDFDIHKTLGETDEEYQEHGSGDVNGSVGIPNDIYSLGREEIWQNHLVNVVSETEFSYKRQVFVSEKIWKPVIGMRPFMINADPRVYSWLEARGFDTFQDLWPTAPHGDDVGSVVHGIVANLKWLSAFTESEKNTWFQSIWPRLQHNRRRFFEYVAEQEEKVSKLFLK